MQVILGGGCFWCLQASFELVPGVSEVVCGYAGGQTLSPSYEQVCTGTTGHAEVVRISFDQKFISLAQILGLFWQIHDPTTKNRQGSDVGTQYRSIIFYEPGQWQTILDSMEKLNFKQKIVTELVVKLDGFTESTDLENFEDEVKISQIFWPAEKEHQNYFTKHPEAAYCQAVIHPKVLKVNQILKNIGR